MSVLTDKLKSTETIIGAIVAVVVVILKYSAVSKFITLPEDFSLYTAHLTTFGVIVVIIVLILLSKQILRISRPLLVLSVLALAIVGVFVATNFVQKSSSSVGEANCTGQTKVAFFIPAAPSAELNALIEPHFDLETAWCESDNADRLHTLARRESAPMRTALTFELLIAELCLAAALTIGVWAVVQRENGTG